MCFGLACMNLACKFCVVRTASPGWISASPFHVLCAMYAVKALQETVSKEQIIF